jgi:D-alanine-D-alanine ligase
MGMKVAVLLGGNSPEREVSLASGKCIINGLREKGHESLPVDPALPLDKQGELGRIIIGEDPPDEEFYVKPERTFDWLGFPQIRESDIVFNALHGGSGEDGRIQAAMEIAGITYTGSGVLSSALAMNKDRSKALFHEANVKTSPHILTRLSGDLEVKRVLMVVESEMGFPVVVKPNNQGSSVGFSFVPNSSGLKDALSKAAIYGDELLVEKYIGGKEITATVLDGTALPLVEVVPQGGFYDYKRKYTKGTSDYIVPADIDESIAGRIKAEAVLAYKALCCRDYARVDFRLSDEGEHVCLELNTLPGMTELSLVPMAAGATGLSFAELVEKICMMALSRAKRQQ